MNKVIIAIIVFTLANTGVAAYFLNEKINTSNAKIESVKVEAQDKLKKVVETTIQVLDHAESGRVLFKNSSYVMCPVLGLADISFPCWIVKDSTLQSGNLAVFDVYVANTTSIDLALSARAWGLTKTTEGDMKLFTTDAENTSEPVVVKAGWRGTIEVRLPSRDIKDLTGVGLRLQVNNIMYHQ